MTDHSPDYVQFRVVRHSLDTPLACDYYLMVEHFEGGPAIETRMTPDEMRAKRQALLCGGYLDYTVWPSPDGALGIMARWDYEAPQEWRRCFYAASTPEDVYRESCRKHDEKFYKKEGGQTT